MAKSKMGTDDADGKPHYTGQAWWLDQDLQRDRLRTQVEIILDAMPDVAVAFGEEDDFATVQYLYRRGVILVRDADLDRVRAVVGGTVPEDGDHSLINGLTALELADIDTPAALALVDSQLGVGVATPDHVLYVTPASCCPATEPENPGQDVPDPAINQSSDYDGTGVLVSVVDTGWISHLDDPKHRWLAGVTGDEEDYDPNDIGPYTGHGTFVAGVVRCMAPQAQIHVEGFLTHGGAILESEMVKKLDQALDRVPDIISMSAGTNSRNNLSLLGFDVFWDSRLQYYKGTVLVAAAGNDHSRGPFWPAAFPWAVSVGALDTRRERAPFTNFGSWVDVYARGVDVVNAYPNGDYRYREPPRASEVEHFDRGMARWSGTSFATPLVAGLIAGRMSWTGESGRRAADALLRIARSHAKPRVGALLYPDMNITGDHCDCECHELHRCLEGRPSQC